MAPRPLGSRPPDDELVQIFRAEVAEELDRLEDILGRPKSGWDSASLFRSAHSIKGAARLVGAVGLQKAAHALEDLFEVLRSDGDFGEAHIAAANDGCTLLRDCFAALEDGEPPSVAPYHARVDELLSGGSPPTAATEPAAPPPSVTVPVSPSTLASKSDTPSEAPAVKRVQTLRVAASKITDLDELVTGLVAQAHTLRTRARDIASVRSSIPATLDPRWRRLDDRLRALEEGVLEDQVRQTYLSGQFQRAIRRLRMVRVDELGSLAKRVVRDTARQTGVQCRLVVDGVDTEIERTLLDHLRDPLVHMLRNAVVHGVESPEARQALGKDPVGIVRFSARSDADEVSISVIDDGRGPDPLSIATRALALGIRTEAQLSHMSQTEIVQLAFEPGLSTSTVTDELSGRGVGLDVVAENIRLIGGSATLGTAPGGGAVFELRVPLTRLTTQGIIVKVGSHRLAFPTDHVARVQEITRKNLKTVDGRPTVLVRDTLIPVVDIAVLLGMDITPPEQGVVVVLSGAGKDVGVLVDVLIGQEELMVHRLAWNLEGMPYVGGTTFLAGGLFAWVVDAAGIVRKDRRALHRPLLQSPVSERVLPRVLVVDDSITSRTLVQNILGAAGYDVVTALQGEHAWELLQEDTFDLVVSDVEMPLLDGIGLTQRIRASDEFAALPVILVTSLGNVAHRDRGAQAGADAYIVKGEFDQDELLRAVGRLT